MAEQSPILLNIARPYGHAAFEYARDKKQLHEWKAFLETASYISQDPSVATLLANPEITEAMLFTLFHDVLVVLLNLEKDDTAYKNFLFLLAQNKRLFALPLIAELFNGHYAAFGKTSTVLVITAIKLQDATLQKLTAALTRRLKQKVALHCETDPAIIGGMVIKTGDRVIDGSISGKLTRLLEFSLR